MFSWPNLVERTCHLYARGLEVLSEVAPRCKKMRIAFRKVMTSLQENFLWPDRSASCFLRANVFSSDEMKRLNQDKNGQRADKFWTKERKYTLKSSYSTRLGRGLPPPWEGSPWGASLELWAKTLLVPGGFLPIGLANRPPWSLWGTWWECWLWQKPGLWFQFKVGLEMQRQTFLCKLASPSDLSQ